MSAFTPSLLSGRATQGCAGHTSAPRLPKGRGRRMCNWPRRNLLAQFNLAFLGLSRALNGWRTRPFQWVPRYPSVTLFVVKDRESRGGLPVAQTPAVAFGPQQGS